MNENKYGNLLDKYMDGGKKYTSPLLTQEAQKYNKSEEEKRYGDLLKNAKPNDKLYEDIINASNAGLRLRQQREEEEKAEIYRHIERLMETSPEAAKAYAEIYANKLKKI